MKTSHQSQYLERNQRILAEITEAFKTNKLQRGESVGKGTGFATYPIGGYDSSILGCKLHLCLKEYHKFRKEIKDIWIYSIARDLSLIRRVEAEVPHLLPEFPVFYGLLQSPGDTFGVITEDFSKGAQHQVRNVSRSWGMTIKPEEVPRDLVKLVEKDIDDHDLATTCFLVNGQRRIGDFGEMFYDLMFPDFERVFPTEDLEKEFENYIVKLDYKV